MLHNDQLDAWNRETFLHPSTHFADFASGALPGRIMRGAKGVHVEDRNGNRLLDAFAGLYCVNVGYGRTEISDAIAEQARELAYYHAYVGHGTEASVTLARMMIDRAPANMSKVYFGLGGSDANETNVKMVWYYHNVTGQPQRKKIISRKRAYHGSGIVSGSLTCLDLFHKQFDLPLPGFLHTEAPYYYGRADAAQSPEEFTAHCVAELEAMIAAEGPETIAAFWAEPVLGTGGIVPPPPGYWQAIQQVLRRHDILLVVDEVITGFGRTGQMFGCDTYGITADIIASAKGLTSAYAPLSASIVSEKVWKVLEKGTETHGAFGHGWTYSAHPICAAAGVANLKLIDSLGLIDNAASVGDYLGQQMTAALGEHVNVGEIRGVGMLCAVELVADRDSRRRFDPLGATAVRIVAEMARRGVIARAMPQSDTIGFAPPLCLTRAEADQIVDVAASSVTSVLGG